MNKIYILGFHDCRHYVNELTLREFRETIQTSTLEKIEKTLGFNNKSQFPKNTEISFIEPTDKK